MSEKIDAAINILRETNQSLAHKTKQQITQVIAEKGFHRYVDTIIRNRMCELGFHKDTNSKKQYGKLDQLINRRMHNENS